MALTSALFFCSLLVAFSYGADGVSVFQSDPTICKGCEITDLEHIVGTNHLLVLTSQTAGDYEQPPAPLITQSLSDSMQLGLGSTQGLVVIKYDYTTNAQTSVYAFVIVLPGTAFDSSRIVNINTEEDYFQVLVNIDAGAVDLQRSTIYGEHCSISMSTTGKCMQPAQAGLYLLQYKLSDGSYVKQIQINMGNPPFMRPRPARQIETDKFIVFSVKSDDVGPIKAGIIFVSKASNEAIYGIQVEHAHDVIIGNFVYDSEFQRFSFSGLATADTGQPTTIAIKEFTDGTMCTFDITSGAATSYVDFFAVLSLNLVDGSHITPTCVNAKALPFEQPNGFPKSMVPAEPLGMAVMTKANIEQQARTLASPVDLAAISPATNINRLLMLAWQPNSNNIMGVIDIFTDVTPSTFTTITDLNYEPLRDETGVPAPAGLPNFRPSPGTRSEDWWAAAVTTRGDLSIIGDLGPSLLEVRVFYFDAVGGKQDKILYDGGGTSPSPTTFNVYTPTNEMFFVIQEVGSNNYQLRGFKDPRTVVTALENDPPVSEIVQGTSYSYIISLTDVDNEEHVVTVDWGDTSVDTIPAGPGASKSVQRSHNFLQPGTKSVSIVAIGADGLGGKLIVPVEVKNFIPEITTLSFPAKPEGTEEFTVDIDFIDKGPVDSHAILAVVFPDNKSTNFGLATALATTLSKDSVENPPIELKGTVILFANVTASARTVALSLTKEVFADSGDKTIYFKLRDDYGFGEQQLELIVTNVAPTITKAPEEIEVFEGAQVEFTVEFSDPGADQWAIAASWHPDENLGDTIVEVEAKEISIVQNVQPVSGFETAVQSPVVALTPKFADNFVAIAKLKIIDDDFGEGIKEVKVIVKNVAPSIVESSIVGYPNVIVEPDSFLQLQGTFNDPGTDDTHSGSMVISILGGQQQTVSLIINQETKTFTMSEAVQMSVVGDNPAIIKIEDKDGDIGELAVTIRVQNVLPKILTAKVNPDTLPFVADFSIKFEFVGNLRYTVRISWGDGNSETITTEQLLKLIENAPRKREINAEDKVVDVNIQHTYESGFYDATGLVIDSLGEEVKLPGSKVVVSPNGLVTTRALTNNANAADGTNAGAESNNEQNNNNSNKEEEENEENNNIIQNETNGATIVTVNVPQLQDPSVLVTQFAQQIQQKQLQQDSYVQILDVLPANVATDDVEQDLSVVVFDNFPIIAASDASPTTGKSNSDDDLVTMGVASIKEVSNKEKKREIEADPFLFDINQVAANYTVVKRIITLNGRRVVNINYTTIASGATILISQYIFDSEQVVRFGNTNYNVKPGTVKWAIELSGITFASQDSLLQIEYTLNSVNPTNGKVTDNGRATQQSQVQIESNDLNVSYELPNSAIIDGVERQNAVSFELVETQLSTTVRFTFPAFKDKLEYDPTVNVLLDGGGSGSGDDDDDTEYILAWLSLALAIFAIIVVVVLAIIGALFPQIHYGGRNARKKKLQQRRAKRRSTTTTTRGTSARPASAT